MWDWLALLPWYVHVAMSFALVMSGLAIALVLRGTKSTDRELLDARMDRAQSVERILARLDQVEQRLLDAASEHRQLARDDWELIQRQLVGVVRDLETVAMEVRQLVSRRKR